MDPVQLGPADRVTAVRAVLALGVAALTVRGLAEPLSGRLTAVLVTLSAVALVLDAVDGYVARRTGTASAFGARFDMETDAFLIAVLSVHVAPRVGWWVLAIGAMRYAYVLAGWALPWLRRPTPPRYWAKVVAAVQGIVLTVAASALPPDPVVRLAAGAALALLVESFGHDVVWQWRHRDDPEPVTPPPAGLVTTAAVVAVWLALAPPHVADGLSPADFARIPVEGLALAALAVVLPARGRRALAVVLGLVVSALAVLRGLGLGFDTYLGRPFDVLGDWSYLPKGYEVVRDTRGGLLAVLTLAGVLALVTALATACGAVPVTLPPEEHDRAVARISHVPHLLASLVAGRLADAPSDHLALSGQGVRDVTRVAGGDPALYGQIVSANADAVLDLLAQVRARLDEAIGALAVGDREVLEALLSEGVAGTRAIPGKHGAPSRPTRSVFVSVPDHPGELARLFADAGDAGVNIEDVRIDHDPGRPVGLVELTVEERSAEQLLGSLESRGWVTHR